MRYFKELEEALEDRGKIWNIITALRGPDFDNAQNLKRLLTARIRELSGLELGRDKCAYRMHRKMAFVDFEIACEELTAWCRVSSEGAQHFLLHQFNALEALQTVVKKNKEDYIEVSALKDLVDSWLDIVRAAIYGSLEDRITKVLQTTVEAKLFAQTFVGSK